MKKYCAYRLYFKCKKCKKEIRLNSYDYYFNAIHFRNQLIEIVGKDNVFIKKEELK